MNRAPKRVGLYGYYNHGNFGDDLMAALVHNDLRAAGFEVLVFGMQAADAADLHMDTEPDVERLVDRCDAVVLGGGGVFIHHARPWPSVVAGYAELGRILERCASQAKPVFGVSMGGSGRSDFPSWQESAKQFGRQARFFTVRNREDLAIAAALGRNDVEQYPDIVWATPEVFPQATESGERGLLLANLYFVGSRRGRIAMRLFLWRLSRIRGIEVRYIDSHAAGPFGARTPQGESAAVRHKFGRLRDDLALLARADLLLTTRLHTGLAALSYGVPMFTLYGETKGRLMLRSVGLEENCLSGLRAATFWWRLRNPARLAAGAARIGEQQRRDLARKSRQHVARLVEHLRQS